MEERVTEYVVTTAFEDSLPPLDEFGPTSSKMRTLPREIFVAQCANTHQGIEYESEGLRIVQQPLLDRFLNMMKENVESICMVSFG